MLQVIVTNRSTGKKQQYKFVQPAVVFGRQHDCDIVLEAGSVSRRHAKISVNHDLIEIEDLGSGNGTVVNHQKIAGHKKIPLKRSDRIRIEEFEIEAFLEESSNPLNKPVNPDMTDPDIIEIKMIKKVLGALDQDKLPCVVVVDDEFSGKKAYFEDGLEELVIGRDETCELSLDSNVISRKHAYITMKWGQFVVIDQQSKNGTFVNGRKIQEKSIKDGDEIVFGTIKSIFKNPQEFDIDSITKSLEEERKQKQEADQQALKEASEQKQKEENQISKAAMSAAAIAKEQDQKQTQQQEKEPVKKEDKSEKTNPEEVDDKVAKKEKAEKKKEPEETKNKARLKKAKTAGKKTKKKASKLTTTEFMLFGFGILAIVVIVIVFIMLFM